MKNKKTNSTIIYFLLTLLSLASMCLFTCHTPRDYDKSKTNYQGKIDKLNNVINKLKESNKGLKGQAHNDKKQIGDLNEKLDKSQKSINNLTKSYDILQSKIKEQQKKYERECKSLDELSVQLKKGLKEKNENIATMQSQLEKIKEKHVDSYHAYVVEKTKNEKLEKENELKTNELIKLVDGLIEKNKNNTDHCQTQLKNHCGILQKKDEKINKLEKENKESDSKINLRK